MTPWVPASKSYSESAILSEGRPWKKLVIYTINDQESTVQSGLSQASEKNLQTFLALFREEVAFLHSVHGNFFYLLGGRHLPQGFWPCLVELSAAFSPEAWSSDIHEGRVCFVSLFLLSHHLDDMIVSPHVRVSLGYRAIKLGKPTTGATVCFFRDIICWKFNQYF